MLGLLRLAAQMLVLAACVYVAVFVPIGRHTLYRHAVRIAATAEAEELKHDVVGAFERTRAAITAQRADAPP